MNLKERGFMDIQKMLKDAEALQKSLTQAQQELSKIDVQGVSGNGLVEVLMTAQGEIKNIKIKKEAVDPNDIETLEDLILSAFHNAASKAVDISQEKLGKLTGGLDLPPML